MYHSTSGKIGYEPHVVFSSANLTREEVRAVLRAEDELRASAEVQQEYADALRSFEFDPPPPGDLFKTEREADVCRSTTAAMHAVLRALAATTERLQERAIRQCVPAEKIAALDVDEQRNQQGQPICCVDARCDHTRRQ